MAREPYTYTGYNPVMKARTRRLRREMTPQERHLWYDFLRTYPVKVYRQRSIGFYIVDFYCSRARLVIELDGSQHFTTEGQVYDNIRSEDLQQYGLEVLRLSNHDIDRSFTEVCTYIDQRIKGELAKWED